MDSLFAPGVAPILLAIAFLGACVGASVTGAIRLLGWSNTQANKIAAVAIRAFLGSQELKDLVRLVADEIMASHALECASVHAELRAQQASLKDHDEQRKTEIERVRAQLDSLNRQVIDLAVLVAGAADR